jgi:hypothetical protein
MGISSSSLLRDWVLEPETSTGWARSSSLTSDPSSRSRMWLSEEFDPTLRITLALMGVSKTDLKEEVSEPYLRHA